jgi:ribosomal protein S18 acetylase RimI-like enzyme
MNSPANSLDSFLHQDEFRHITPLKLLTLFGSRMSCIPLAVGAETAYLLWSQRDVSHYDSAKYPTADLVFYPAFDDAPSAAILNACARAMLIEAVGRAFVVKTIELALIDALRAAAPQANFNFERALATFTTFATPSNAIVAASRLSVEPLDVRAAPAIPEAARSLLDAHNVYSASELETMFTGRDGRCFVSYRDQRAVAVTLSFSNSRSLYEIGSLYVAPTARRAGHASALVCAALADLSARGLVARYVVDATNAPSIALAERCELREAMRLEHWLVTGG